MAAHTQSVYASATALVESLELCFLAQSCFRWCQPTAGSLRLIRMSTDPNRHGAPLRAFLSSVWFVSDLATLATISQNYHAYGVLFSPVTRSVDITVDIHALWICLNRFLMDAVNVRHLPSVPPHGDRIIYGKVENSRSSSRAQSSATRVPHLA
ncbi:hypothetical protein BS47DRAFT_1398614 [Hydnum rufescens UP504]|uniref:Uncharacterized protein n=1 Tax=Hydnum rufescens UP504 TaxID=1448309 RepID=A0A9P6AKB6_9AGAM|nr:hypothetical protein BS47DRAFT_1398614 [Hydnum rufescens UP504]